MQISALSMAVASGGLVGMLAFGLGLLAQRFGAGKFGLVVLGVVLALSVFFVPPPLVLMARAGILEVTNPGHAGANFMLPYFGICIAASPVALVLSRSRGRRS